MLIVIISAFISGIAGGMGIGGGAILIPALIFFSNLSQHVAQSTNLIFFIPTAISALIIHIKNKNIKEIILKQHKTLALILSSIRAFTFLIILAETYSCRNPKYLPGAYC